MFFDDVAHIIHAAVADLDFVLVNNSVKLVIRGKCLARRWRNSLPILFCTCSLYGGLNQIAFCFLCLLLLAPACFLSVQRISLVGWPLWHMASALTETAFAKWFSSLKSCERRFDSIAGSCFVMAGGRGGWTVC